MTAIPTPQWCFGTLRSAYAVILWALLVSAAAGPATYHSFSNSNTVSRVNGDGGLRYSFPLPNLGSFTQPSGIAIDPLAKKLYYARANFVGSVNLDGSGNTTVKDFGLNSAPSHLEIDTHTGLLYAYFNGHAQGMARGIYRMKTDGTELTPIVTVAILAAIEPPVDPLVKPDGQDDMVIDTVNGRLFWSEDRVLYGSSLSGLDPVVLSTFPYNISGFDVHPTTGKLYFSNSTVINRSDLDGSKLEVVLSPGFGFPEALELDVDRGRLYFIQDSALRYTNLDGSLAPVEVIGTGPSRGKDIEIGPMPVLSEPRVVSVARVSVGNAFRLRIGHTTDPGIHYSVESSGDLTAGSWIATGVRVIGTGSVMSSDYFFDAERKFFRVLRDDPCE